jgi:hypothetical protein
VSWARKLVPRTWNILILSARRHVHDKETKENSSRGQGVRSQGKRVLQGLHLRSDFDSLVNSDMKSALGQRCKDETCDVIKYDTKGLLPCEIL